MKRSANAEAIRKAKKRHFVAAMGLTVAVVMAIAVTKAIVQRRLRLQKPVLFQTEESDDRANFAARDLRFIALTDSCK